MRIRLGDFGGKVAPTATERQRVNPRAAFVDPDAGLAEGAMNAAAGLLRQERAEEDRLAREAQAEAKQAERERIANEKQAARNKAAAAFATYRVQSEQAATDIVVEMTEGRLSREDARKQLDTRLADLKKTHLEGMDEDNKAALADNLILFDGQANARFNVSLRDLARRERVDTFQQAVEALQRVATTDRAGALRQAEMLFGGEGKAILGPDKAGKGLQQFREQVAYTDYDRGIVASMSNGKGLADLLKRVGQDQDLAPERRGALEARILNAQQKLIHQGEVAERRRMAGLEQQTRRLSWYIENGRDVPAAEMDKYIKASKGTPYEGTVDMIVAEQKAVAELQRLSPAEMAAKVRDLEKSYGPTPTREQITHLDKVRRFADRSMKLLSESPLDYAVARDGAKVEPLDLANPQSWAGNLAARTTVLSEQSARTGAAPKGLFPQEAAAITQLLRDAPVAQKTQVLTSLRQGFGDDRVYRATMQQIAPDDPVLAVAGVAAGRGLESARDKALSDLILRGQMVLRPNKKEDGSPGKAGLLPMPKDDEMLRSFESYSREAFAGHELARNAYLQTARAIYAAKAVEAGDFTGNLDSGRWRDAMQLATGGIENVNGRRTVLPHGRTKSQFMDELDARVKRVSEAGVLDERMTPQRLRNLPLEVVGDGKYMFRAGDGVVVGKDRKPIVLDFNESLPFTPSGDRGEAPDNRQTTTKGRSSGK